MNEIQELLQILRQCAKRPTMYGFHPESLELLSQHLSHICYSISDEMWTWQSTQNKWQAIASCLGYQGHLATPTYETTDYRQRKWGVEETDVRDELLQIFKGIWQVHSSSEITRPRTASWIETLFQRPELLGSPDCTDLIMRTLLEFAVKEHKETVKEAYIQRCLILRGSASRGFNSYRTVKGWTVFSHKIDREEFDHVSNGVLLVIEDIERLVS